MATNFDAYTRLDPRPHERNLQAGIAAAIQDPLWFIARQWQMGELQGENATSPVWAAYELKSGPVRAAGARFDPAVTPAEAIVESELDDWWTMGRRVRLGRLVAGQVAFSEEQDEEHQLRFSKPAPPYEHFHGEYDGLALWRKRDVLGIAPGLFGVGVPGDSMPAWDDQHLLYQQNELNAFTADQRRLTVNRHRGGRMDLHSVDGAVALDSIQGVVEPREAIPTALQYPGAPNSRWWQFEDSEIDPGAYVPDSAHTPTALLTELIFSHSDDWFLFPVLAKAGNIVSIESMEVIDAFGRSYRSQDVLDDGEPRWPGLHPPRDWTLFQVEGLNAHDLLLWHVAELPLEGIPVERVQFGADEESNLVWAVERTIDGREVGSRDLGSADPTLAPGLNEGKPSGDTSKDREFAYVPGRGIAPYWHPYQLNEDDVPRRLVQHRLADLSRQRPAPMPAPRAEVLKPAAGAATHQIAPLAIPSNGIEIERRWMLARDMTGAPVPWVQRQRRSLLSPPARRLRFDVMEEAKE